MEKQFKVGQKLRVTGTNANGLYHHIDVGNIVIVEASKGSYGESIYGTNVTVRCSKADLRQCISVDDLEPIVDFAQPLYTAEGTPVTFVSDKGRDPKFPVLAYEGKAKKLSKFTTDGIHSSGEARRNLTNTEVKRTQVLTGYVNVYKNDDGTLRSGGLFETERFKASGAVGRVKVTLTAVEGVFDA